jgi:hypothetical protein
MSRKPVPLRRFGSPRGRRAQLTNEGTRFSMNTNSSQTGVFLFRFQVELWSWQKSIRSRTSIWHWATNDSPYAVVPMNRFSSRGKKVIIDTVSNVTAFTDKCKCFMVQSRNSCLACDQDGRGQWKDRSSKNNRFKNIQWGRWIKSLYPRRT